MENYSALRVQGESQCKTLPIEQNCCMWKRK